MRRFASRDGAGRFLAVAMLAGLGLPAVTARGADRCALQRLVEAPMLQDEYYSPVISVMIDDKPKKVLLDTGGWWSMITPEIAANYPQRRAPVESLLGLHALPMDHSVKLPSIQIGPAKIDDVEFFVAPKDYLSFDGTLGANWLSVFDVEIDPVKNTASLFSHDHCDGQVVYWPHDDLAVIPFDLERYGNHITMSLLLNDEKVHAMLDTGAPETVLSLRAAKRLFDLKPDSPGMQVTSTEKDDAGNVHTTYRYQFASLKMGDIVFKNPWIRITDVTGGDQDMILGMHQLHALHLYFAYKEEKLYVTTAHGDIAAQGPAATRSGQAAAPAAGGDPLARINARDFVEAAYDAMKRDDAPAAKVEIDKAIAADPGFATAYVMRGAIREATGENALAATDFEQALRLDPKDLDIYVQRSQMEWRTGDHGHAFADLAQAIQNDPNFTPAYLLRASYETDGHQQDLAVADATQAIRTAPGSTDGYSLRAQVHARFGDYAHAFEDETVVVKMTPKSAPALNNRCWFAAILGKLDVALDDCNTALDLEPKSATTLDSRAYVRFRLGQWDRALTDYSAALTIDPKIPSSLYGRGIVKRQKGDMAGGDADIAAAQSLDPKIADHFGK